MLLGEDDVRTATTQAAELHDRFVHVAYGLYFSCANVARLLEQQANLAHDPPGTDLRAEGKRWDATARQVLPVVRAWDAMVLPTGRSEGSADPPRESGETLDDYVVNELFRVGLRLEAVRPLTEDHVRDRLGEAVDVLDDIIRQVRGRALDRKAG